MTTLEVEGALIPWRICYKSVTYIPGSPRTFLAKVQEMQLAREESRRKRELGTLMKTGFGYQTIDGLPKKGKGLE